MNFRDRQLRGVLAAVAAAALALGMTACQQDTPPQAKSGMDPAAQPGPPESPKGALAGTAEEKLGRAGGGTGPLAMSDSDLAGRVKAALAADPALKSLTVDVTAMGTDITLHGTADTTGNREKASLVALNVQGVRSVENKLVVVRGS